MSQALRTGVQPKRISPPVNEDVWEIHHNRKPASIQEVLKRGNCWMGEEAVQENSGRLQQ